MATVAKKTMDTAAVWFEVPVSKLQRAKKFYQSLFEIEMIDVEMDTEEGLKMAMFPVNEGGVGGALCEHPEFYHPSHKGSMVYFNAGPDLQHVLNRVEPNGGKILQTKKKISDEYGYMAIFEDTEGNRLALHSME